MAGNSKPAKRKDLCLSNRVLVIEKLEKKATQCEVAKEFGISQSQVSRIWKTKQKLLSAHQGNINPSRKSDKITSLRGCAITFFVSTSDRHSEDVCC